MPVVPQDGDGGRGKYHQEAKGQGSFLKVALSMSDKWFGSFRIEQNDNDRYLGQDPIE